MISSYEQSVRDKALHQEKQAKRREQEKRDSTSRKVKWFLSMMVVITVGFYLNQSAEQGAEAGYAAAHKKYSAWVAYRDIHCKVIEKSYGLTITSGKFSSQDNAVGYECDNGVKYLISQNEENKLKQGRGNIRFVPDVP